MALIVVLVLLTIAIAATMTFGDTGAPLRFLSRFRFLPSRRRARAPGAAGIALTATPSPLTGTALGGSRAESVLVALLLDGRLSQRGYQQEMAKLAAEDSARGARPEAAG